MAKKKKRKKKKKSKKKEEAKKEKEKVKKKKIKDLPGVGKKTAEKLKEKGYEDFMSIAASSASELKEKIDIGEATGNKIIQAARDSLDLGFDTVEKLVERREKVGKITTGSEELDELLGGGMETQSIVEAHGAFGSGKSQLGFQAAVNALLPKKRGGLNKNSVIIDTEGTLRPERLEQIGKAAGLKKKDILKRILTVRAYNSDHQILLVDKLPEIIRENNIGVVVLDSLTSQFRSDYTGRGTLATRQQKLNKHLHTLQKIADVYNVAIFVTNQVMAKPDVLFGDPTSPIGGHILGHQATFRLYLRKSKGDKRIARLIDSPSLPEGECVFVINDKGIRDKK